MVIIADDLTGANDTAVQFVKKNCSVIVKPLWPRNGMSLSAYGVISVNTESRALSTALAYERVKSVTEKLSSAGETVFYKKIDSVLRGNPAAELEGMMDVLNCSCAFVAPAFPANGRIIKNGLLCLGEAEIEALDLFKRDCRRKTAGIFLSDIKKGEAFLAALVTEKHAQGESVFVLDAVCDDDLRIISKAAELMKDKPLLCGSAGLAAQLDVTAGFSGKSFGSATDSFDNVRKTGAVLTVIGSRHTQTARQVKNAAQFYGVQVIPFEAALCEQSPEEASSRCFKAAARQLESGAETLIIAVDSLFKTYNFALKENEADYKAAAIIAESLGSVCGRLLSSFQIRGFVASGGDTSIELCSVFDAAGIELFGEVAAGIPAGRLLGGSAESALLVTKSGGFGNPDAIIQSIEYIRNFGRNT